MFFSPILALILRYHEVSIPLARSMVEATVSECRSAFAPWTALVMHRVGLPCRGNRKDVKKDYSCGMRCLIMSALNLQYRVRRPLQLPLVEQ